MSLCLPYKTLWPLLQSFLSYCAAWHTDRQIWQLYHCCVCRRRQWTIPVTFNVEAIRPPCAVIYPLNSWEVKEWIQIWRNIQNQSNFNHKRISQLKRTTCWKRLWKVCFGVDYLGTPNSRTQKSDSLYSSEMLVCFTDSQGMEISSLTSHARPSKLCTNPADCTC